MNKNKLLPIERNRGMKEKESYTLEELCNSLSITLTKFCQMAGITEGTLIRLRQGYAARRVTINKILETFSKVYGLDFSLDNVSGLIPQEHTTHRGKKQPEQKPIPYELPQTEVAQIRSTEPKRTYSARKVDLPEGCISASEFAMKHGVARQSFYDHIKLGLGAGLIHGPNVPEDGSVLVRDYVRAEERDKRVRKDGVVEKDRYLTQDQQKAAVEFWQRHQVSFTQCESTPCWCHTLLEEEE